LPRTKPGADRTTEKIPSRQDRAEFDGLQESAIARTGAQLERAFDDRQLHQEMGGPTSVTRREPSPMAEAVRRA